LCRTVKDVIFAAITLSDRIVVEVLASFLCSVYFEEMQALHARSATIKAFGELILSLLPSKTFSNIFRHG
jgi:Flp pilus assembly protein protease CpaA